MKRYRTYHPRTIEYMKKIFEVIKKSETFTIDFICKKSGINIETLSNVFQTLKIARAVRLTTLNKKPIWLKTETYLEFVDYVNNQPIRTVRAYIRKGYATVPNRMEFFGMGTPQHIKDLQNTMWQMRRGVTCVEYTSNYK